MREKVPSTHSLTDILIRRGRGRERKGDGSPFRVFTRCIIFGGISPSSSSFSLLLSSFRLKFLSSRAQCIKRGNACKCKLAHFSFPLIISQIPVGQSLIRPLPPRNFFMLELLELESFRCRTTWNHLLGLRKTKELPRMRNGLSLGNGLGKPYKRTGERVICRSVGYARVFTFRLPHFIPSSSHSLSRTSALCFLLHFPSPRSSRCRDPGCKIHRRILGDTQALSINVL